MKFFFINFKYYLFFLCNIYIVISNYLQTNTSLALTYLKKQTNTDNFYVSINILHKILSIQNHYVTKLNSI